MLEILQMNNEDEGYNYRHDAIHKLSNGLLAVTQETSQGSYVIANDVLKEGQILLECPSASIALDSLYRHSHCGFCARPAWSAVPCAVCHAIITCTFCQEKGATKWHTQSGECRILRCLVDCHCQLFAEFQNLSLSSAALQIDSISFLTMRLVHRRQSDSVPCPLPDIDWKLLELLHTSPLPPASGFSSNFINAMATLLQRMNDQQQPAKIINSQECLLMWNKCRGCCHAITDLSRPLGSQQIGVALFLPHSFYNHGCAPNAFLSCLLQDDQTSPCAVTARVVSCRDRQPKGEPILLSYIPMSGLCLTERQMRLKESYQFVCDCRICKGSTSPNTEAFELEQVVGGEFATTQEQVIQILGPLRELQIECHQTLLTAASMEGFGDNSELDSKRDCLEQCIATLEMAQRGIRNNRIPYSHEVSLECHRLLAWAHSLLQGTEGSINQELYHHKEFLKAATKARPLIDPTALAVQHQLMAQCLLKKVIDEASGESKEPVKEQLEAIRIASIVLGEDHPFVSSLRSSLVSHESSNSTILNKKRKLEQEQKDILTGE